LQKKTILLLFIFLSIVQLFSQGLTQQIRGVVIDREFEFPLMGATVQLLNIEPVLGTSTNSEGEFVLKEVPVGRHTIKVSYIGYDELVLPNVLIGSAKELILNCPPKSISSIR